MSRLPKITRLGQKGDQSRAVVTHVKHSKLSFTVQKIRPDLWVADFAGGGCSPMSRIEREMFKLIENEIK